MKKGIKENKIDIQELLVARKTLTNKIVDMDWRFSGRQEKILELNIQIAKIDELIKILTP